MPSPQTKPTFYPPLDPSAIYDELDRQTLIRAFRDLHPEVGFMSVFNAYKREGSNPHNVGIMETSVDSNEIVLTGNSETIYAVHPVTIDEQGGAVVLEVPMGMQGMAIRPAWWLITDIGGLGPDKGQGGKYLFTREGYTGDVPEGCFHFSSPTNTIMWLLRGFVENGDTEAAVRGMKEGIKTYSLAEAGDPPPTRFYNTSAKLGDHYMDMLFEAEDVFPMIRQYFELNGPDANPAHLQIYSYLLEMGFFGDGFDSGLLAEAAQAADEIMRTQTFNNRAPDAVKWPGKSSWQWANNFSDENFLGRTTKYYSASQQQVWSYMATFNSVGMTRPPKGIGSQYIMATKDAHGQWLDGSNHYTLTVPADPPAKDFWSVILYNLIYGMSFVNVAETGPLVFEAPPKLQGILLDFWQRPIPVDGGDFAGDVGLPGPDGGAGGKFLIVPPEYDGPVPEGHYVYRSGTNNVFVFLRSFYQSLDNISPAVDVLKQCVFYPLDGKASAKTMVFHDASGKPHNMLPRRGVEAFDQLKWLIDSEGDGLCEADWRGIPPY